MHGLKIIPVQDPGVNLFVLRYAFKRVFRLARTESHTLTEKDLFRIASNLAKDETYTHTVRSDLLKITHEYSETVSRRGFSRGDKYENDTNGAKIWRGSYCFDPILYCEDAPYEA